MSREQLALLGRIARDAGEGILRTYASDFGVDYKGPGDPVTDADRQANSLICARLHAEFPDAAVVAEESAPASYAGYQSHSHVFFVDPLDGTREFVAKNGQFVVMIGLLVDDQPRLGVVYAPVTGVLWCGGPGLGAYREDADGVAREISVSRVSLAAESLVTISRSRRSDALNRALQRLTPRQTVPMGSAGLKGSHVAEASADAYLAFGSAGKLWDACAMDALVTAAGGRVTDTRGRALRYRSPRLDLDDGLLVANPVLHQAMLSQLQDPVDASES